MGVPAADTISINAIDPRATLTPLSFASPTVTSRQEPRSIAMSNTARRSFFGGLSSEENASILADPTVSYRLLYWDVASVGGTARDILAYGKARWTNQIPMVNLLPRIQQPS